LTATIGSAALSAEIAGAVPRTSRVANLAVLAAAGVAVDTAEAAEPVILGDGQYRYKVLENWGEVPPGFTYGDAAAVCVDSKDNVYVFTRGAHPVIVFMAPRPGLMICSTLPTTSVMRCASARQTERWC
jgi:hypothetical protein